GSLLESSRVFRRGGNSRGGEVGSPYSCTDNPGCSTPSDSRLSPCASRGDRTPRRHPPPMPFDTQATSGRGKVGRGVALAMAATLAAALAAARGEPGRRAAWRGADPSVASLALEVRVRRRPYRFEVVERSSGQVLLRHRGTTFKAL